jgi:two-component system, NarL family, response regulator LiaR
MLAVSTRPVDKSHRRIRVLLVDDHEIFRVGLRRLLEEQGFEVVAEAGDGDSAVRLTRSLCPDVVTMDTDMPGMSGVEATERIIRAAPTARVLVLSSSAEESDVVDAVMAGACGYLLKRSSPEELAMGVKACANGESMVSPSVTGQLLRRFRSGGTNQGFAEPFERELSDRELEILKLLAQGKDNAEIARVLILSPKTVKNHISAILRKLEIDNRIEAAVYAVRRGIV